MSEDNENTERSKLLRHTEIYGFHINKCEFVPHVLRVRIVGATNLMKKDIFGTSDPYCKLSLYKSIRSASVVGSTVQTRTMKKTLNPRWNEEFLFRVNINENRLVIELYDENRLTRDDFLGVISIHLPQLEICTESVSSHLAPKSFKLRPRSSRSNVKGNLILYLAYLPNDVDPVSWTPGPSDEGNNIPGMITDSEISIQAEENSAAEVLANGWEERVDQNGRIYYVDHKSKRTQWEKPTNTPLPEGWEERTDLSGRVYYVDHTNQKTQWEHPASKSAPQKTNKVTTKINMPASSNPLSVRGVSPNRAGPSDVDAATMYLRRRQISHEDTVASRVRPTTAENQPNPEPTIEPPLITASVENVTKELASTSVDDELPPGWQMAMTTNGRRFFINHNDKSTTWEDPRAIRNRSKSTSGTPAPTAINRTSSRDDLLIDLGPLPAGWEEREHTDGRIFFVNHNTKTTQWEDPRLNKFSGPAVPYSRNYKQKYDYFRSKLRAPREPNAKFEMRISRKNIFEDSYRLIYNVKKTEMLKYKLWIEFIGEKGLDYGGVQREWFFLLSREMFNPYYGLFEYSAADNYTLQINPLSGVANENHLKYFKFIGRVAGMAVYHGRLLDGFFIRPLYKMMLGKKISLKDMESVDTEYYRSLKFILENDPAVLDLTFSVDEEHFGQKIEVDLIPDGRSKIVTQENKRQYIECIINWRFVKRVELQMTSFLEGFQDVVTLNTLQIFDANELELLLCGLQDINVNDWKGNTNYKGEYNPNHPVIVNFWKTVYTFNNELRSRLLQFVTGTSRVPMNGFVELWGSTGPQKFTIEKWGSPEQLPRAHTCFNRLDLPPYLTFEELRRKLLIAIENAEGFEGVD